MRGWSPERVAHAAGARLLQAGAPGGPSGVAISSAHVAEGDLFVGLPGANVDGGSFLLDALAAGAWGVLVHARHIEDLRCGVEGNLIGSEDPLAALGLLARSWRRELGAQVVGVTGSTGKTSTKDLLAGMIAQGRRVVATSGNLNTEIGLPLTVLGAPEGTEVLVLEMAMRGAGQIAELVAIAEPDVGLITNIGPVHLEQLGSVEAIAAEKAALVAGLRAGGTAIVPAGEPLLEAHRRDDVSTVTFGPGGDVADLGDLEVGGWGRMSAHMHLNALAALAAARAVGVEPRGLVEVALSELRGERLELPGGIVVVNDCYNANPMSMRAALDDLDATARGRKVAILGDMLELGPGEERFHREAGEHARRAGVDVLVTVGPRAAAMAEPFGGEAHAAADAGEAAAIAPRILRAGDTVLVKGSRGVGLEVVAEALAKAGV